MKHPPIFLILISMAVLFSGCENPFKRKINWRVTLNREDKNPYGCYIAYQSLKDFFPQAAITPLSKWYKYKNLEEKWKQPAEEKSLLILVGLDLHVTQPEWDHLVSFAKNGNEVIVFSRYLDETIRKSLGCNIDYTGSEERPMPVWDSANENLDALRLIPVPNKKYGFNGRNICSYFEWASSASDTLLSDDEQEERLFNESLAPSSFEAETLGKVKENPDFIRYQMGDGHITLHAAPLVMSNYFLLQKNNQEYLQAIWNTLPNDIRHIYWNGYFKRNIEHSDFSALFKFPATFWAFWVALFALLVFVLFEGKRKQRIIPVIEPLGNSSATFVETIGRLYYNKGDHTGLADKMIQHFLEWVRTKLYLSTNQLDETFEKQLALRSDMPESVVQSLMELIREVHIEKKKMNETDLYHLHHTIQRFYKKQTP